jgi:predicted RecB family nuclease
MQFLDGQLLVSATDLVNHLECPHLSHLDREVASGLLELEQTRTDTAELLSQKGDEHEASWLEQLRADGREIVEIPTPPNTLAGLQEAAQATADAMRAGAEIIYQGALLDGRWRGYSDFLERVEQPSPKLGDWSYEVVDTKLARRTKAYYLVQLCVYSELVGAIQGRMPEQMHVVLGTRQRDTFRVAEFAAYVSHLRTRFEARLADGFQDTYPEPVEHCSLCRWSDHCDARRVEDDHLSLVAGMGAAQTMRCADAGIATVAQLAQAGAEDRPRRIGAATFERLRQQARLQVAERESGQSSYELLEPEEETEPARGFHLLPEPSPGDLYFDIEGDPFYEDGLEYLWGVTRVASDGEPEFRAFWGRDRAEEKRAFEGFIDLVMEQLAIHPDLHVYHYAPYEPTALKTLMGRHATREDEVDQLLRNKVLVDLYSVVRQGIRISKPSYSIKKVEAFYMPAREAAVTDGGDSIVRFEEWLENGDDSLLEAIERYNEEDCESTVLLHRWLLGLRAQCEAQYGVTLPWRASVPTGPPEADEASAEVVALQRPLLEDIPDDPGERSDEEQSRWLLAQLLDYHRRDEKPGWWEFFSRFDKSLDELETEDSEALAGLTAVGDPVALPAPSRSSIYTMSFPSQEHKISRGTFVDPTTARVDPETGVLDPFSATRFKVARVLDDQGVVEIIRATARQGESLPVALIPATHYGSELQRAALLDVATEVVAHGLDGGGDHLAARSLLTRALPRTTATHAGGSLQGDLAFTTRIAAGLQDSHLFIQGPPGSGKTYTGAQLILSLLEAGHRVGVTANSHKAIHNLLHEIEKFAGERDVAFRGLQKCVGEGSRFESKLDDPLIEVSDSNKAFPTPEGVELMAGTAWLWCREEMRASVDYLVIDEAGQISLADALALSTAASNVILLGDPLQLAQVSQGTHPPGAGRSVLEHMLGDDGTIPPERGTFLDHTRRMHPDVCRFVSEVVYEDRLQALPEMANQSVASPGLTGTGVRYVPVSHEANTRSSIEEAEAIAREVALLLDGGTFTNKDGVTRELCAKDIMLVTPYNAQVRCLRDKLPDGVEVGTVDKFQGREAAVVFFSMATSSGAEIPRNVEFLYSRNRLNVAVSRARCLAVLVCSPELMHIKCRSAEQMRLVNALCRLVDLAHEGAAT